MTQLHFPERSKLPASSLETGSDAAKTLVAVEPRARAQSCARPVLGLAGFLGSRQSTPQPPYPRRLASPCVEARPGQNSPETLAPNSRGKHTKSSERLAKLGMVLSNRRMESPSGFEDVE